MYLQVVLRIGFLALLLPGCVEEVANEPSMPPPSGLIGPPNRVEGQVEVDADSLTFDGFAYEGRFHPIEGECAASSLIYIQGSGFGGLLGVEGDVLEGVTVLAPTDAMDDQTLWYQDPGPNWSEDDPANFAYGGTWRLSQVADGLIVSIEPEQICPGRPFQGGCAPGVPVELTLRWIGISTVACDSPAELAGPRRANGDLPLCSGFLPGRCDPPDGPGN